MTCDLHQDQTFFLNYNFKTKVLLFLFNLPNIIPFDFYQMYLILPQSSWDNFLNIQYMTAVKIDINCHQFHTF